MLWLPFIHIFIKTSYGCGRCSHWTSKRIIYYGVRSMNPIYLPTSIRDFQFRYTMNSNMSNVLVSGCKLAQIPFEVRRCNVPYILKCVLYLQSIMNETVYYYVMSTHSITILFKLGSLDLLIGILRWTVSFRLFTIKAN